MKTIQVIESGVCVNVIAVDDASTLVDGVLTTPAGVFPAPDGAAFMAQAGPAGIGWTLADGVLSEPAH